MKKKKLNEKIDNLEIWCGLEQSRVNKAIASLRRNLVERQTKLKEQIEAAAPKSDGEVEAWETENGTLKEVPFHEAIRAMVCEGKSAKMVGWNKGLYILYGVTRGELQTETGDNYSLSASSWSQNWIILEEGY
jgi:hypothetical protein